MLLNNKTIFVTGAGRGIGREILLTALREGASVAAHMGRLSAFDTTEIDAGENKFLPLSGDLAEPGVADKLWSDALAWRGRIDALVNNAVSMYPHLLNPLHNGSKDGSAICC